MIDRTRNRIDIVEYSGRLRAQSNINRRNKHSCLSFSLQLYVDYRLVKLYERAMANAHTAQNNASETAGVVQRCVWSIALRNGRTERLNIQILYYLRLVPRPAKYSTTRALARFLIVRISNFSVRKIEPSLCRSEDAIAEDPLMSWGAVLYRLLFKSS